MAFGQLNPGGAFGTVLSGPFLMTVGSVVAGGLGGMMLTDWLQENVVDIGVNGGDALYGLVGALVALMLAPGRIGRGLAIGMAAAGAESAAADFNLI